MRYLRYTLILLWTLFRKVFGLAWYPIVAPHRKYARNTVYNYVLSNGLYLPRLNRDVPISKRNVSWIEYQLVYWLIWGWLDDDSYCDTSSERFMLEWEDGTRGTRDNSKYLAKCNGNAFTLGDTIESNWCGMMAYLWNVRNTAYNFKYMQWEENRHKYLFYYNVFGYEFGYHTEESDSKHVGRLVFIK